MNATIGLFWIYSAIFLSLCALGLFYVAFVAQISTAICNLLRMKCDPCNNCCSCTQFLFYRLGIGFMVSSLFIGFGNIVESIITIFINIHEGKKLDEYIYKIQRVSDYRGIFWLQFSLIGTIFLISIITSIWSVFYSTASILWCFNFIVLIVGWILIIPLRKQIQ